MRQPALAAQSAVARVLAEAETLAEATPRLLEAIGGSLGWEVGAIWTVDRDGTLVAAAGHLHPGGLWDDVNLERGRRRGELAQFRRVIVETSGLAQPGPILQLFIESPLLRGRFVLEALVAVVDAQAGFGALAVVISLLYVANKFGKTLMQKLVEKTMRIDNFIDGTDVHC